MQVRRIPDATNWKTWSNDLFFTNLQKTFGKNTGGTRLSAVEQIYQGVEKLPFDFDPDKSASWSDHCLGIDKIIRDAGIHKTPISEADEKAIAKKDMVENLKHSNPSSCYAAAVDRFREKMTLKLEELTTFSSFMFMLSVLSNEVADIKAKNIEYGLTVSHNEATNKPNRDFSKGGPRESKNARKIIQATDPKARRQNPTEPTNMKANQKTYAQAAADTI